MSVTSLTPRSRAKLMQSKVNLNNQNTSDEMRSTTGSATTHMLSSTLFQNQHLQQNLFKSPSSTTNFRTKQNLSQALPSPTPAERDGFFNAPNNLRLNNEFAEYDYDHMPEKELKISQQEYEDFKRKYHLMVFDGKGNYLYSKTE